MVVIIANIKIVYSTNNHTIFSTLIILLSIASFYVMVFIESHLNFINVMIGLFDYAMRIPAFYFIAAFFILATAFTEKLLHWSNLYITQNKERKQEIAAKLLKLEKIQESALIRKGGAKHMGFAFSGDDRGSTVSRGMSIMNTKKINAHDGQQMEGIEEEKSDDGLEMSLE
jgi:hypothetical protein